ncbi:MULTISPECIES: DUF3617 family protein [unclassified Sphingomonas]|nr:MULTISPECIES: DUF3617 family protein [unclassified Sphingomonas]
MAIAAAAPIVQPGRWEVKSTVVEMAVPGIPKFLQRMARGKTKSEEKRLTAAQGIETLLAPDPKAMCRIEGQRVEDGRYMQTLSCPQKQGDPLHITRGGTYDRTGFVGRATVAGVTSRGPISIVLDQRAVRTGG